MGDFVQRPVVHVRSIFNQGLIFLPPSSWPSHLLDKTHSRYSCASKVCTAYGEKLLCILSQLASQLQISSAQKLATSYVQGHNFIDGIVVGVDNVAQLDVNVASFQESPLSHEQIEQIDKIFENCAIPPAMLDPRQWGALSLDDIS